MNSTQAPDGANGKLLSNSRWNLLAFAASLMVNFATLPIVVAAIGLPAFGVGGLVLAIYAPFMLVGTVLGQAMVKELAPLLLATPRRDAHAASLLSTAIFLCVVGSIAVTASLVALANVAMTLFDVQDDLAVDWWLAFLVAGLGWAAQQVVLVIQGSIATTQRYAAVAQLSVVTAVVSAICAVAGSKWMPDYRGFLIGTSAGFIISVVLWTFQARRQLPFLFPLPRVSLTDMKTIAAFGKWQGGAHFVGAVSNQIDRYLLGILAPLAVVGQFNIAMRLQEVVHMGLLKATEVLLPHFAVTATDSPERRSTFFLQASWALNLLGACALAPLIPLAHSLISLWIGPEAAQGSAPMLRTLAAAGVLGCGVNVYYYFALGTGQQARMAALTVAHAVLTIALTAASLLLWGPVAAGAGYLGANLLRLGVSLWLTRNHFSDAMRSTQLLQTTLPPLAIGLAIAYSAWRMDLLHPTSWWALLVQYALVALMIGGGTALAACTSPSGRALVRHSAQALRQTFRRN